MLTGWTRFGSKGKSEGSGLLGELPKTASLRNVRFNLKPPKGSVTMQLFIVFVWFLASSAFWNTVEGWPWLDSFYASVCVLTTVGYGDEAPKTELGRVGMIISVLVGVSIVVYAISMLATRMSHVAESRLKRSQGKGQKGEDDLLQAYKDDLKMAIMLLIFCLTTGMLFVHFVEGFGFLDALYWAVISSSAVGFGDLPLGTSSRAFCIFYLPIAVATCGATAAALVSLVQQSENVKRVRAFVARGVTPEMIAEVDKDGNGSVDRFEFVTYLLVGQGKLNGDDISHALALFDSLDKDGSGTLDTKDFRNSMATPPLKAEHIVEARPVGDAPGEVQRASGAA